MEIYFSFGTKFRVLVYPWKPRKLVPYEQYYFHSILHKMYVKVKVGDLINVFDLF